jgi:hypothetical protein
MSLFYTGFFRADYVMPKRDGPTQSSFWEVPRTPFRRSFAFQTTPVAVAEQLAIDSS